MTIQRMDHVGVVVDDMEAAKAFFVELGLTLKGEWTAEGAWVDRVVGLEGVRADCAMVETPDGHAPLELVKFHTPSAGALRERVPALLHPRPGGDHRRARRADRLTVSVLTVGVRPTAVIAAGRSTATSTRRATRRSRSGTWCGETSRRRGPRLWGTTRARPQQLSRVFVRHF
jgi:catechol 2,3-dioxygenase-like lactoylglutathione lyase family enzyme